MGGRLQESIVLSKLIPALMAMLVGLAPVAHAETSGSAEAAPAMQHAESLPLSLSQVLMGTSAQGEHLTPAISGTLESQAWHHAAAQ